MINPAILLSVHIQQLSNQTAAANVSLVEVHRISVVNQVAVPNPERCLDTELPVRNRHLL